MARIEIGKNKEALQVALVDSTNLPRIANKTLKRAKFHAEYNKTLYLPTENCLLIGIKWQQQYKNTDPFARVDYFELGASSYRAAEKISPTQIVLANWGQSTIEKDQVCQFVLGFVQARWKFTDYLADQGDANQVVIYLDLPQSSLPTSRQLDQLLALDKAMCRARYAIELPPARLNPSTIEIFVNDSIKRDDTSIEILDQNELVKRGMNAIVTVGEGSIHRPLLMHAILRPSGPVKRRIVLVGKGITYDSGGLDVKTEGHMRTMKMDMAGAITTLASFMVAQQIGLKNTELHWISPFAENMISGGSYKADDIVSTYSGLTVEIGNTDAEGRLILADALTYATTLSPDYIVDVATLTGAAIVALSPHYSAMMGNDENLIKQLMDNFYDQNELVVWTPMPEVLRQYVGGRISDLINTSKLPKLAGHLTAGLFLSHFIEPSKFRNPNLKSVKKKACKWVHIDIAGTAYNEGQNKLQVNGATGAGIRSLSAWILSDV